MRKSSIKPCLKNNWSILSFPKPNCIVRDCVLGKGIKKRLNKSTNNPIMFVFSEISKNFPGKGQLKVNKMNVAEKVNSNNEALFFMWLTLPSQTTGSRSPHYNCS